MADARVPVWINGALADDRARHTGLACRPVVGEEVVAFCQLVMGSEFPLRHLKEVRWAARRV